MNGRAARLVADRQPGRALAPLDHPLVPSPTVPLLWVAASSQVGAHGRDWPLKHRMMSPMACSYDS
jgi:hypothetical protein